MRIGILALQGDISEHVEMTRKALEEMEVEGEVQPVKTSEEISSLDGLILPGGESTMMGNISSKSQLLTEIRRRIGQGLPTLGTCAGLILLAKEVNDSRIGKTGHPSLGLLGIRVLRNAYGRQFDSFEANLNLEGVDGEPFHGVFIRAPIVESILAEDAKPFGHYEGKIVAVQQGNIIGTSFHPELSGDARIHQRFLKLTEKGHPS